MNAENLILKRSLVLQSFAPLFILLAIKHIKLDTFWHLMVSFIKLFSDKGLVAVSIAVKNENFGSFVSYVNFDMLPGSKGPAANASEWAYQVNGLS